ncbi:MAG TPA: DUF2723 domain-containing protein [Gemmatimonadaceae bacterium]|nr:DUF2723 domain-containing protein [Gemmatimonadaceae bacterium]
MATSRPRSHRFLAAAAAAAAAGAAFVAAALVFWYTAYPTITWWDSSGYSLAAATLGVYSPPGSLLLTLLGWPVAHIAGGAAAARALNFLAATLAAATVALVVVVATRLLRVSSDQSRAADLSNAAPVTGAALGALALGFSDTLWSYASAFTPYILTPVFTALILLVLVRWWEDADGPSAWRWAALLAFLFGVDFSVHRTNALLIPGALVWIAIRRPRTLIDRRVIVAGIGFLAAGLALQLLLIPIATFDHSPLDFNHPSTLSSLWDYVTIKQLGGSFLLQLFPRKSPIWSSQSIDLLRTLRDDFARWRWGFGLGGLPALAALGGVVAIGRRRPRLAAAALALLVVQASFTVLYFNIPANYFRTFDRHYLPVVVTTGVLAACGVGAAAEAALAAVRSSRRAVGVVLAALVLLVPAGQLVMNWRTHDASRRYFTHDYAKNVLEQLPPNAIYFTVGDNDTFPIMYLQAVEGVRRDVTNINLSVANVPGWPERLRRRDPALPMSLNAAQRNALVDSAWTDSVVVLPVHGRPESFGLAAGTPLPDSITLRVVPSGGRRMIPAEVVLLDIVRTNDWRRPLTFATTGTASAMEWLAPFGRLDGLYSRIVPVHQAPVDAHLLRENVIVRADYRGYADSNVQLDGVSRTLGMQAYGGLIALLDADRAAGLLDQCRADRAALLAKLPLDRLSPPPDVVDPLQSSCDGTSSAK